MKSAVLAFLSLATSNLILCVADSQVKVKEVKGTEVNCSRYMHSKDQRSLACPRIYLPVCGTNQQSFGNECVLCSFILERRTKIRKLHDGKCIQCPKEEKKFCTYEYTPLCASDGNVYANKCDFCNTYVKSRGAVTFSHNGNC